MLSLWIVREDGSIVSGWGSNYHGARMAAERMNQAYRPNHHMIAAFDRARAIWYEVGSPNDKPPPPPPPHGAGPGEVVFPDGRSVISR